MFAFVERLGYFPSEYGVHGADNNENDGIGECDHVASVDVTIADEEIIFSSWVVVHGLDWIDDHPDTINQDLNEDQHRADNELRSGRDEGRPLCAVFARAKNTGDPIGFCEQGRVDNSEAKASSEPVKVKSS